MQPFLAIDHVQLAMPPGREEEARAFFVDLLGMTEIPKPPELASRGGCWFASGDVHVHLGVEEDFRAARKAHPGLRCADYPALVAYLRSRGVQVTPDTSGSGLSRSYIDDPFGNRIELLAS